MSYQDQELLARSKKPNIVNGQIVHGEEEDHIPEEFSSDGNPGKLFTIQNTDIEDDDMEEFMEYEEEFEARQSISSRGSAAQPSKNRNIGRATGVEKFNVNQAEHREGTVTKPQENLHNYHEAYEGEENFGEGESSSVITEIVDEQVVEIETENEEELNQIVENQKDEVNQYLDNIKKEEYVNREEYDEKEQSPDQPQRDTEDNYRRQYEQDHGYDPEADYQQEENRYAEDGEFQQDQHYVEDGHQYDQQDHERIGEEDPEYEQDDYNQHQDNQYMMENSPIAEDPIEEELTGSPQMYEAPRAINPKIRRKYQNMNVDDKSHLIWEQERLERLRIERQMRRVHAWEQPNNSREIDWHPTVNPRRAAYNLAKNPKRSKLWHFSNSSSVPMLSTAKAIKEKAANKNTRSKYDPKEAQSKKDHKINNLFLQSSYQNILSGKTTQISTPSSHVSLQKENGRGFMTPIDNRYQNQMNVQEGRNRMFHTSNVF